MPRAPVIAIADAPATRRRRMVVAVLVAAAIVATAPIAGVARSELQSALGPRFSRVLTLAIAALVLAMLVGAWRRAPPMSARRSAMLVAAVAAAIAYVGWTSSDDPAIRAVELFHFVEYGAIATAFYRVWRDRADAASFLLAGVAAFIAGIAEEAYQWFLPARVGELRDVGLNGVAIACALGAIGAVSAPGRLAVRSHGDAGPIRRALAVTVAALAAFVHVVHLGVRIVDGPDTFDSRYTAAQLATIGAARATTWRLRPPLARPDRLSREDQYMTEGLQHVQARNTAWASGDTATAWHENQILERHFAPVLDAPSYVASTGHRWSAAQRDDARQRAADAANRPFVSTAFPYPLLLWSPVQLWATALAVISALIVVSWTAQRGARSLDH